jgi:CHASE1-domain containing sensor protein
MLRPDPKFNDYARRLRPALLIFVLALAITIGGAILIRQFIHQRQFARFKQSSESALETVETYLLVLNQVMSGVKGLFASRDHVSRQELEGYFKSIEMDRMGAATGVHDVGIILKVPASGTNEHIARLRSDYPTSYNFRSKRINEDHFPIIHLQNGTNTFEDPLGWDVSNDPVRFAVLSRARDQGVPQMTPRIPILDAFGKSSTDGVIIYMPFYRNGVVPTTVEERRSHSRLYFFLLCYRAALEGGFKTRRPCQCSDLRWY